MAQVTTIETALDPTWPLLVWARIHTDVGLVGLGVSFKVVHYAGFAGAEIRAVIALDIALWADSYQWPVAPHNPGGPVSHFVAAHFSASVYNLFVMESVRAFYLTWFNEALTHNLTQVDGEFPLPVGPGLGTELREDFLSRPELIRRVSRQAKSQVSGYAVGDPFRTGNPWVAERRASYSQRKGERQS